jgi:hypothetical protein
MSAPAPQTFSEIQSTEREQSNSPKGNTAGPDEGSAIAALAYRFWELRGCPEGSSEEDWFRRNRNCNPKSVGCQPVKSCVLKSWLGPALRWLRLNGFRSEVCRPWRQALLRRSQRHRSTGPVSIASPVSTSRIPGSASLPGGAPDEPTIRVACFCGAARSDVSQDQQDTRSRSRRSTVPAPSRTLPTCMAARSEPRKWMYTRVRESGFSCLSRGFSRL